MAKVNFGESPPAYEFDSTTVGNFSRFRETMVNELNKMGSQLDTPNEGSRTAAFQSVVDRLLNIADGLKFYRIQLESNIIEQYAPRSKSSAIYLALAATGRSFEYVK
ncbi:unnamed protein product [Penicillium manginii]